MPRALSSAESAKVESKRKSSKPEVYDPNGTSATPISNNFESWLILSSPGVKGQLLAWIKQLLQQDVEKDYQDLLKETLDKEESSLTAQQDALTPQITAYTDWKSSAGVRGWEDVAEIAWMLQELQTGFTAYQQQDALAHRQALRRAVAARHVASADSTANKKARLGAWVSALNTY